MQHIPNHQIGVAGIGATVVTYIIAEIVKYDAFLHGMASVVTILGAVVSIYFMFKKNRSKTP